MTLIFLTFIDLLSKFLIGKHFFALLPFLIIFFLNHNKYFIYLFLIFSFLNDLFIILPLGFTGFVLGSIFTLLLFVSKFININAGWNILIINTLVLLVLLLAIFYVLKINLFNFFAFIFFINFLYSTFIIILYKIIY